MSRLAIRDSLGGRSRTPMHGPRHSYPTLCRFMGCGGKLSRAKSESGQSLIEFAVSFSVLMGMLFVFIELCLAFYTYGMIAECAREGSRYASVRGATCVTSASASCTASIADIRSYVLARGFPNLGGGHLTVDPSFPDVNQAVGSRVKVKVTYIFPITLPLVPRNSISLKSTSVMYFIQ